MSEFKADARYFYGNWITQVFNKICVFISTSLLKPLKLRSWISAFYAKPQSWLLAPSQPINVATELNLRLVFIIARMDLVTAFKQLCVRDHSFPKSDYLKGSWIQPGSGNQYFPVLVSLFSNHAHEGTVSLSLVASHITSN